MKLLNLNAVLIKAKLGVLSIMFSLKEVLKGIIKKKVQ
jgi:hypothetical protein